jgi:hypothetical protein
VPPGESTLTKAWSFTVERKAKETEPHRTSSSRYTTSCRSQQSRSRIDSCRTAPNAGATARSARSGWWPAKTDCTYDLLCPSAPRLKWARLRFACIDRVCFATFARAKEPIPTYLFEQSTESFLAIDYVEWHDSMKIVDSPQSVNRFSARYPSGIRF